jgi:hypothetical protein
MQAFKQAVHNQVQPRGPGGVFRTAPGKMLTIMSLANDKRARVCYPVPIALEAGT